MKIRRTPYAFAVATLSLGLLAACSDEADQPADAPMSQEAPATNVPPTGTAPDAPATTTPPPVEPTAPAPSSSTVPSDPEPASSSPYSSAAPGLAEQLAASGQALQASAREAAHSVGEKAGELRAATSTRMSQVGQAIRDGAAKADETIQSSMNGGGEPTTNTSVTRGS